MKPKLTQSIKLLLIILFVSLLTTNSKTVFAQPLTGGDIVVLRAGSGATALSSAAFPVAVLEYTTAGTLKNTYSFPSASAPYCTGAGSSVEGFPTISPDGSFLIVSGYNVAPATASVGSVSGSNRVIGILTSGGVVSLPQTALAAVTSNNIRGACTDGTNNCWMAGASGDVYVNKSTGTVASPVLTSVNSRGIAIFNGQLYYSTGSGTTGMYSLGTGLPTSGTQTATFLVAAASPYTFSISPDGNTMYCSDDGSAANGGGIKKFTRNGAGVWSLAYTLLNNGTTTTGTTAVVVDWSGANPVIYATGKVASNNAIIKVTDAGASSTATTVVAGAGTNFAFKGIAFAPGTPSVQISNVTNVGPYRATADNYTIGSGPIATSNLFFTVSGSNLTNDLVVTAPADYEVSNNSATSGFGATVTITPTSGAVAATNIYVRLKTGLSTATYNNENVTVASVGVVQPGNLSVNAQVVAATPAITVPSSAVTLSGFLTSTTGGASPSQSFTISAVNLINPLTLNAPAGYEISQTVGGASGYAATQNLGTTVNNLTIYVRLKAGDASGLYNSANITSSSSDVTVNGVTVAILNGQVYSGTFSAGNLVVETLGDGTSPLNSAADVVNLWEYDNTGVITNKFTFPHAGTLPSSAPYNLTESGSATSGGRVGRSADGTLITVAGYNASYLTASVVSTTSPTNLRTMGLADYAGTLNSNNAYNIFSGNNFRSVASNGFSYWAAGTVTGGAGLYYLFNAASAPISLGNVNTRELGIYNGNMYFSTASTGNTGIYQVGTNGLPLSAAAASAQTLLTDAAYAASSSSSPYGFSINPAGNVMYVADDASWVNTSTERGGILRFNLVGSTWTYQYTIQSYASTTSGARGITVDWSGASPIIYATASQTSSLVKITDDGSKTPGTVIATAAANFAYRGVQFSPVHVTAPTVFATAKQLDFGGEPVGGTTAEQVFNASGYNISGNVTVTAPSGYGVSLTSGGPYTSSVTIAGPVANAPVYVVFKPVALGADNLNLTVAASGATTVNVPLTGTGVTAIDYYCASTGDLTDVHTWGTNTDGSGTNPLDFISGGQIFHIVNQTAPILTSPWTISGTSSKVVVGDTATAVNLTVASGSPLTGTVDVTANATLTLQDAALPALGTLAATSTVVFNQSGTVNIPVATYGNLTLKGSVPATDVRNLPQASSLVPLVVNGNLTVNGASVFGNNGAQHTYVQLGGDLIGANNAIFLPTPSLGTGFIFSVITSGNGDQTISYPNGKIYLFTLTSTKTAGTVTLGTNTTLVSVGSSGLFTGTVLNFSGNASFVSQSGSSLNATGSANVNLNFTGTGSFTLGGNLNAADSTSKIIGTGSTPSSSVYGNFATGTSFIDGGNTVAVSNNFGLEGTGTYTLTGTVIMAPFTGTTPVIENDNTVKGVIVPALNNLTIYPHTGAGNVTIAPATGTATIVVGGNLTISGSATGSKFTPNANTIQVAGNFTDSRTIDMIAAGSSTFEFNGSAPQTITNAFTGGESFFNVKINNATGVTLGGAARNIKITSTGNLNVANGILNTTGTGKVVLNNTATITETNTSYVLGKVTSTRTLVANTNETYGGMGIEVKALGSAPGSTVATRVIGTESGLGCASSSVLRYFDVVPTTNTGLNATIVFHYFDSPFELNGFTESYLTLFKSINNGSSWTSLTTANNVPSNTLSVTAQASLGRFSAGTTVPAGGLASPTYKIICPTTSANLSVSGSLGQLVWESSIDNVNWDSIPGAHAATYAASPSVNTFYRTLATFPGCMSIASTTATVNVSSPTISLPPSSVTAVSDNSVTLNWSPIGSGNFNIGYSGASSGTILGTTPPKTITGLTAGGNYTFTITQTGVAGTCTSSGTIAVSTLCPAPVVTVTGVGNNNINLSWTGSAGNYRVYYRPLYAFNFYYTKDVIGATSVSLTTQGNNQLYKAVTYEVYVASLDCPTAGVVGAPSAKVYPTTTPALSCAAPVIDSVKSLCPVQLEAWVHGSPTNQYYMDIQRLTPTVQPVTSYPVAGGYFTLNVSAGQTYLITARSICGGAVSNMTLWAGNLTIKPQCGNLTNLVLSNATCSGFTASWNADQCLANNTSYYDVYIRQVGTINWNGYPATSLTQGSLYKDINWLGKGKSYQVFVKSVYACDGYLTYGTATQTLNISTLSAGCREEEAEQPEESKPLTQQASADNNEVFSLFPNPNNGQFTIEISSLNTDDRDVRVEVLNLLGQTVVTNLTSISGGQLSQYINMPSNTTTGTYIVRVTVGKNVYTSKMNISK